MKKSLKAFSMLLSVITLLTSVTVVSVGAVEQERVIDSLQNITQYTTPLGENVYNDENTGFQYTYAGTVENSDGSKLDVLVWYGSLEDQICMEKYGDYLVFSPGTTGADKGIFFVATDEGIFRMCEVCNERYPDMDRVYAVMKSNDKTYPYISLFGDADSNGVVNIKDATHIQKYIAGIDSQQRYIYSYKKVIDVNGDRIVDIKDVTELQNKILG